MLFSALTEYSSRLTAHPKTVLRCGSQTKSRLIGIPLRRLTLFTLSAASTVRRDVEQQIQTDSTYNILEILHRPLSDRSPKRIISSGRRSRPPPARVELSSVRRRNGHRQRLGPRLNAWNPISAIGVRVKRYEKSWTRNRRTIICHRIDFIDCFPECIAVRCAIVSPAAVEAITSPEEQLDQRN